MESTKNIILVTGVASGIGQATAMHFHQLGATVVGLDLMPLDLEFYTVDADISDAASLEAAFEKITQNVGVPRGIVHCAGVVDGARAVGRDGPQPLERFQKIIDVNLTGTFNLLRLGAHAMMSETPLEKGERGVIIMTASVAAFDGQVGQLAYAASKGGVAAMTLPAAREFGQFGIRVMTIAPGIIKTPMMASLPQAVESSLSEQLPFPKRLGDPAEYAKLAEHIFENTYLNGEVIRLDAGLRMAAK